MPRTFDLFLSHNSRDKPAVREIAEALRRREIRVWLDEDELIAGRPWQEALENIIETARAAAVLVGKDGLGPWEDREMRACLSEFVARELPVIPVLLPGASAKPKLPLFLRAFTWVDLRSGITEDGLDRLVRGIPKAKRKPRSKPALPGPPPLHNLPYSPLGDLLKGRDDELSQLAESLQGDGQPRAIVQEHRTLYGLGGIGKTRLAVEYAWRFGSRYRAAFFVRAESPETLSNGLASLAVLLNLPERQAQAETIQAVLLCLQTHPGWLLILDNVDSKEAERAVLAIRPMLTGGQVLITSRLRDWPPNVKCQSLDTISQDEAREFLLSRTDGRRRRMADDPAQAEFLAEKLGGLPLALTQAGAYIAHTRLSFSEYLKIWEEEKVRVLEWHDETMEYPTSVATTWKASFDRLQPTAAGLIREALAELESYSLISREEAACTVHRVVLEVVQSRIPQEQRREWLESSLKIVNRYSPVPPDDVRTWPVWNVLRSHAARIVLLADEAGVTDPTGRLMGQVAVYFNTRGLYTEAEPLMRRAVVIGEASLGIEHPEVAIRLNNLAQLLQTTNRLSEAEPLMRRSLAIDDASFGNEHPNVARNLNNLAQLLQATNRLSEAEPLMRRSLAIDEASFGNEHPNVAIRLNNLAQLLKATNRLSEAEPLMRRSLAIDEASFGNEHPRVAIDLNNLALLLKATNRLSEAEPLIRRALAIDEASFGIEHPEVAIDLNNLALLFQATSRLSEAEPLMRRAVEIWQQSLGPDHPSTQIVKGNLARLLAEIKGGED